MSEKKSLLAELKREGTSTRKILERITTEHFSWKPHDKSYSTLSLAQHVANLPFWISLIINSDEFDLANPVPGREPVANRDALLAFFDQRIAEAATALENAEDSSLDKIWLLKKGGVTTANAPKKIMIRFIALNHIVHHRGQLSVYLRMQDIPVPGMYGPSADEK